MSKTLASLVLPLARHVTSSTTLTSVSVYVQTQISLQGWYLTWGRGDMSPH